MDLAALDPVVLSAVSRATIYLCAMEWQWQPHRALASRPSLGAAYAHLNAAWVHATHARLTHVTLCAEDQQYTAHTTGDEQCSKRDAASHAAVGVRSEAEFEAALAAGDTRAVLLRDLERKYYMPPKKQARPTRGAGHMADVTRELAARPTVPDQRDDGPQQIHDVWQHAITRAPFPYEPKPTAWALGPLAAAQMERSQRHARCHLDAACTHAVHEATGDGPAPLNPHDYAVASSTVWHPCNLTLLASHPQNLNSVLVHFSTSRPDTGGAGPPMLDALAAAAAAAAAPRAHTDKRTSPRCVRATTASDSSDEQDDPTVTDNFDFSGVSSSSWYVKDVDSFFYLHCEQFGSWFTNYCHTGSMRWYCVAFVDLPRVVGVLMPRVLDAGLTARRITPAEHAAMSALVGTSAEPQIARDIVRMLVLAKQTFPSIAALEAAGQSQRHERERSAAVRVFAAPCCTTHLMRH